MTTEKFLMLDTETTNDIDNPLCYDLGYAIIDTTGKIYETGSYVVADIFLDSELMETAYFKDKVPMYWEQIKNGTRKLCRWNTIRNMVKETMNKWNITKVVAHNVKFDYLSTATTQRYLTSSKYRYFFPSTTRFIDTLKMARMVLGKNKKYIDFCKINNYVCKNNTPRFTAEIIYRYLTENTFVESHTALEDVKIETEIFAYCANRINVESGELCF